MASGKENKLVKYKTTRCKASHNEFVTEKIALSKTNIAPENRPSQKETSLPSIDFQGRAVSFRKGRALKTLL